MAHIIESLLDLDLYKLTMGQLVFLQYPIVPVRYAFKNRTAKVQLPNHISESVLRAELDHVRSLSFTPEELKYLEEKPKTEDGTPIFCKYFLQFLAKLKLPPYELTNNGKEFILEFFGPWREAIYWETIALSIINELYYRSLTRSLGKFQEGVGRVAGVARLHMKISKLKDLPDIRFSDFGTRRRFSRQWQEDVVEICAKKLKSQFVGTSNVALAMKHGLKPIGTFAHEMFMVMSGIFHENDDTIRRSHNQVLCDWWDLYGESLSIALTDTYGTDFFFRDMSADKAQAWKGLRQDSGCPFEFGEKAIAFYERLGIDPLQKMVVFSDGLNVETIIKLYKTFSARIRPAFGWGTNLTNDLGFEPLSLVVKAVEANGHGTVKLSDNLAKATGKPEDIERFKRIFGHTVTRDEMCTY